MTPIFIHIPKAGGRTLLGICYRQYWMERDRIWKTKGGFDGPVFLDHAIERKIDDPVIIMGHLYWGIHEHARSYQYFTMLRDPIRRTLSQYYHIQRSGTLDAIPEFLNAGHTTLVDNAQTRFISGMNPPYGECDEAMLEVAKEHLSQCVVGLLEEYDRSLLHFQKSFGWKPPYYVRINESKPYSSSLSARDRAAILRRNWLDIQLYAYGKVLFERQQSISQSQVASFQRLNSLHRWRFRYRRYVKDPARALSGLTLGLVADQVSPTP